MYYANARHARRCRNVMRGKKYGPRNLAALYLFTADHKLWQRWRQSVNSEGIDWSAGKNIDLGWDGYSLEKAALSIAKHSAVAVTLHDLADCADYPQELLRLVITALWIARNDPKNITEIIIEKEKNAPKQRPHRKK